jgi:2-polyprenyl-3-methyl-5-hydroxy-6-metoxy-1,4-benzoquinol methylase
MLENLQRAVKFLCQGQFRRVWNEIHVRIYRIVWEVLFVFILPFRRRGRAAPAGAFTRETKYIVAFESPDHLAPKGTAENNSTNKKFVLHMDAKLHEEFAQETLRFMDLGCSGGQLVADFLKLRWLGAGLEGSDYSLKHRRANWATLANTNLFTCDITKPYLLKLDGQPAKFHLITAWEVMEHLATPDLDQVFRNVIDHLEVGGYFVASTTETPDMHEGLELHQTQWTNAQWRAYVENKFPELEYSDVGLKIYQYVRYNFLHPSFLLYRKKAAPSK